MPSKGQHEGGGSDGGLAAAMSPMAILQAGSGGNVNVGGGLGVWLAGFDLGQYAGLVDQLGYRSVPAVLEMGPEGLDQLGGRLMMPPGHLSRLRRAVESERLE